MDIQEAWDYVCEEAERSLDTDDKRFQDSLRKALGMVERELFEKRIEVPMSESDVHDLLDGDEHNWEFDNVKVRLYREDI